MAKEVTELAIVVNPAKAKQGAQEVQRALDGVGRSARGATTATDKTEGAFERLRKAAFSVRGAIAAMGLASATLLMRRLASAAIDFETAMAGVAKTIDAPTATIARLGREFQSLSEQIPVSATELANIGEAAGQLGIATDNILSFTRVMADLGVATNLTSEEAATAFARFANIMQTPQDQFDRMGSTVVALGNNLATTEREIVEFATRMAGAGAIAGLAESDIFAIAGALSSVGVEAEAGGTAVQKVLVDMNTAVAQGNENLARFAKVAGMSTAAFAKAWRDDAGAAFTEFVEGLGAAGDNATTVLEELGLNNDRLIRAFLSLGNAGDLLRRSLGLSSEAWRENSALTQEAERFYETLGNQLKTLGNLAKNTAAEFGARLAPAIKEGVGVATVGLGALRDNVDLLVDAMLSLTVAAGAAGAASALNSFGVAAKAAGGAVALLTNAVRALLVAIGPHGWLILGVGAVAAGMFTWLRTMRDTRNGVDELAAANDRAAQSVSELASQYNALSLAQVVAEKERVRIAQQQAQTDVNVLQRDLEAKERRWIETHGNLMGNPFKDLTEQLNEANERLAVQKGLMGELTTRELVLAKAASESARTTLAAREDVVDATDKAKAAFERLRDELVKERNEILIANELRQRGADAAYRLSLALTDDLTPAMREQLIAMREQNKEIERQILLTGRLNPRLAAGGSLRTVGAIGSGRPAWAYEGSILRRAAEEGQDALEAEQVWARAMENIQDVFADGFEDIFRDGLDGFKSMADAVGKIFGGLGRQIAAALAIEKLGIDDIIKTIREKGIDGLSTKQKIGGSALAGFGIGYGSGNAGMGFLGGAGAGYALGGPMGALGGAVAGLAGGLLGAAQKTREAQRIFSETMTGVRESLEDIRDAAAGISDPMKGLRDRLNDAFDTIRKAVGERFGAHFGDRQLRTPQDIQDYIDALSRIPASLRPRGVNEFIRELENLHDTFAESAKLLEGSYRESLQDRLDALTGNDAAVLLRKQQKEREEAIRAGFDASTLALLDQVHEQERLKQATDATSDAIRNVTSALNSPSGLRLSLHRWRATAPGLDPELAPFNPSRDTNIPPVTQHNGDVIIQITQQPGESSQDLAERIVVAAERKQRRGGPAVINRISSR